MFIIYYMKILTVNFIITFLDYKVSCAEEIVFVVLILSLGKCYLFYCYIEL